MPKMTRLEQAYCASRPWALLNERIVIPLILGRQAISGRVLEIGSGAGSAARWIAEHKDPELVVATDVDIELLSIGASRMSAPGPIRLVAADACRLPVPDCSFDWVVSMIMLHHVVTWELAVTEAARVLRPGGTFVGYDLARSFGTRMLEIFERSPHRFVAQQELFEKLCSNGLQPLSFRRVMGLFVYFVAKKDANRRPGRDSESLSRQVV